jgi:hypothetical protein
MPALAKMSGGHVSQEVGMGIEGKRERRTVDGPMFRLCEVEEGKEGVPGCDVGFEVAEIVMCDGRLIDIA